MECNIAIVRSTGGGGLKKIVFEYYNAAGEYNWPAIKIENNQWKSNREQFRY